MAHFILVTFPLAGHINPTLQFAYRLVRSGARVTFLTTVYAHRHMIKSPAPDGLSYATFSDGYDDDPRPTYENSFVVPDFRPRSEEALAHLMRTLADEGRAVSSVIYTIIHHWAADVARTFQIPSVLLWIQPATCFGAYYYYFHGYDDYIIECIKKGPSTSVKLPGLPLFSSQELPSFFHPLDKNASIMALFREQFETLDKEERPRVLVNTIESIEPNAIVAVDGVHQIGVGPLIPSIFLDGQDGSNTVKGVEVHNNSRNYIEWLDSKPASSVVYVSFGSLLVPSSNQMVEILNGLLESGHPFLWVIRPTSNGAKTDAEMGFWERERSAEEMKEGMVVPWCSQAEVLLHSSVGCFVSHCGWNSTVESLSASVPLVCLPFWTDQNTNAKLVQDVWKAGIRAKANEDGVFEGGELKRCLDLVMGGDEIRNNALMFRDLASKAVEEGGSSNRNIQALVDEMKGEGGPGDCSSQAVKLIERENGRDFEESAIEPTLSLQEAVDISCIEK